MAAVSFNGAVTFWLRKSYSGCIISFSEMRFNGAVTFWLRKSSNGSCITDSRKSELQWGRNFLVTEIREISRKVTLVRFCFNGAVTFWLRKYTLLDTAKLANTCFNGAVTFWLRKSINGNEQDLDASELQWGRNFLVTEMIRRRNKNGEKKRASMGP